MSKIKVPGLPWVRKKVWEKHKALLFACRELQVAGFGHGTVPYEVALESLKRNAYDNNLLLGHVNTIAQECDSKHAA